MAPSGVATVLKAVKSAIPDIITKRRLDFRTIHYMYIAGMALFWSAIFYAMGADIPYIDSLFFTSGACTQSGLNTIDVNKLHTGQQFLLYLLPMMTNPIVIHGSVVFIRLYWFEKRFQKIAKDAQQLRKTKSKSKQTKDSYNSGDPEAFQSDTTARGRAIQLLMSTGHGIGGRIIGYNNHHNDDKETKDLDSTDTSQDHQHEVTEKPQRRSSTQSLEEVRLPSQYNAEQHIQFLENQINPKDNTALRIPGPRDYERGERPQSVDESADDIRRQVSRIDDPNMEVPGVPRVAQHITFNEPDHPQHHRQAQIPRIDTGKASTMDPSTYDEDPALRGRTRRNSTGLGRTNTFRTADPAPYLSYQPTIARNSLFVGLTEEQREELGGIEYRSLKTLALILLGFFFGFHLLGVVCLLPWIYGTSYGAIVREASQGRTWWGFFTAGSSFNDLGFTLTPDSMISFQTAVFPLLLMSYLIIIGNTGFPCMLRFVIWIMSKCVPVGSGLWEELQFLLDHPRRCFTLLFPRAATWWLFAILVILNGVDLIFFIILDLNDETVEALAPGIRVLVGIFQAASTRTAGFAAVNIADLHPAIQVSYLIMMYISVFPIAISMRRTNVYEEKSLGIYANPEEDDGDDSDPSYVGAHLKKQLGFDLWFVFLCLFVICIVEGSRLENTNEYAFTIFSVLFEIVSAYGTVGLSLGYPTVNASFSSQFHVLSKLVIVLTQIRGRHRGLPYDLDRAILLPSESLQRKEAHEGEKMLNRFRTNMTRWETRNGINEEEEPLPAATSYKSNQTNDSNTQGGEEILNGPRRRFTNKSTASSTQSRDSHRSNALSRGLGNTMYRAAEAPSAIKEEAENLTPSSH